jgi:hypothetical protein
MLALIQQETSSCLCGCLLCPSSNFRIPRSRMRFFLLSILVKSAKGQEYRMGKVPSKSKRGGFHMVRSDMIQSYFDPDENIKNEKIIYPYQFFNILIHPCMLPCRDSTKW